MLSREDKPQSQGGLPRTVVIASQAWSFFAADVECTEWCKEGFKRNPAIRGKRKS
jgi:hypothetical protein